MRTLNTPSMILTLSVGQPKSICELFMRTLLMVPTNSVALRRTLSSSENRLTPPIKRPPVANELLLPCVSHLHKHAHTK